MLSVLMLYKDKMLEICNRKKRFGGEKVESEVRIFGILKEVQHDNIIQTTKRNGSENNDDYCLVCCDTCLLFLLHIRSFCLFFFPTMMVYFRHSLD